MIQRFHALVAAMAQAMPLPMSVLSLLALLLTLWRVYTFTLVPYLKPSRPKALPYAIPFLGHAIGFFRDSDRLIERGLNHVNRSYEPFALHVMGTSLYVVTNAADVTAVFRDSAALNFDAHLARLLKNFGVKPKAFEKAWHKPRPGDWCYIANNPINSGQLDLIHLVEETFKKQLLPGPHMDDMSRAFLRSVMETLTWDRLESFDTTQNKPSDCRLSDTGSKKLQQVSLHSLCRWTLVEAATRAMFGNQLHDIDPRIVDSMCEFNDHVWMVIFGYAPLWNNPSAEPRRRLMDALKRLVLLEPDARGDEAWAVTVILQALDIVGIDVESSASMMLMSYWAAVSNEYNTAFWMLAYMLHDKGLGERIKSETEAAFKSGHLDIKYLCANSTHLTALLYETLRLNNGAAAIRTVTRKTTVGGKVLEPGNSVMIPFKQLHHNATVWGSTTHVFDPQRFIDAKTLARHPSYRPFGGGVTYCPGRALAKEQVFGFIAILLRRFDMTLAPAGEHARPFPELNSSKPSLGVMGPREGMDVLVAVTPSGHGPA